MNRPLRFRQVAVLVAILGLALSPGIWSGAVHGPFAQVATDPKLAPFVPTPQSVVEMMLTMAEVKKGDTVYDALKSGVADPLVANLESSGIAIAGSAVYMAGLRGARLWQIPINGEQAGQPRASPGGRG